MDTCLINTPLGCTEIKGDEFGVNSISILNTDNLETKVIPNNLEECAIQLKEYFNGTRHYFDFKINPKGTDFQKKVWQELSKIPFGKTASYAEVSKRIGNIKAIRAVASANGKNPLWIVIPCHRVIGSDGSLTGYAGGLKRKQWLLNHENPFKQQVLF